MECIEIADSESVDLEVSLTQWSGCEWPTCSMRNSVVSIFYCLKFSIEDTGG